MIRRVFRPQPRAAWVRAFCSPASRSTVSEIQATACYVAKRIDTTRLHNELKQLWSHRSVSSSADRDWLFLGFGFELGDPASAVDGVQLAVSRRGSTVLFNAAPADPRYNIDSLIADSRTAMVLAPGDKVVHDSMLAMQAIRMVMILNSMPDRDQPCPSEVEHHSTRRNSFE